LVIVWVGLVKGHLLDGIFVAEAAAVFADDAHFLATKSSVLDGHAEQCVFVLLVVGRECVLVEQYEFSFIRAGFRELRKIFSDGRDQAGLSLHAFVIGHGAMRIVDLASRWVPHGESSPRRR